MTNATASAAPSLRSRLDAAVSIDTPERMRHVRNIAVVGIVLLNACDLILTRRLLDLGGVEANPLMAPFIHGNLVVLFKLGVPLAIGIRHLLKPIQDRRVVLALCWMCVLYSGVVLWNLHLFDNPALLG
jgi:hypothetical protein